MPGTKYSRVLAEHGDGMLGDRGVVSSIRFLVPQVHVIATHKSDAQHNLRHGHAL